MLKTTINRLFLFSSVVLLLASCKKSSNDESENTGTEELKYSLFVSSGTPAGNYILQSSTLSSGTISTNGNGAESDITVVTAKNGFYYGTTSGGNLVKFTSDNKKNTIVKEIPFTRIDWAYWSSFYLWKDDKTLVFFAVSNATQYQYAILDVETMTYTASGNINIPKPPTGYYYWGNAATFVGNKLYISYTTLQDGTDNTTNESYLAAVDFPAMNNIVVTKDTRFNFPSHYTLHAQGAFTYNNTAYFLNSPTLWSTKSATTPFAVYKVDNGATKVNETYFYELTADKTKEEALGLYNVGNGKAITKIIDRTKIGSSSSYASVFNTEYYLVDVVNQTKTKLNIPKSISNGYTENVFADNGIAYIAAKTENGYFVYEYDLSNGTLKTGLKLDGINNVYRLEKIR